MTRQQAYINHYKMWDEIVENPKLSKEQTEICKEYVLAGDTPGFGHRCFLCVIHSDIHCDEDECSDCPLQLATGINCHEQTIENRNWWGEFYDTNRTIYPGRKFSLPEIKERKQLAEKIRDCVVPYLTEKSKGVISK